MAQGIFRSFHKENSPLSYYLRQRFLRPAEREIERLPLEGLSDPAAVARRLAEQHRVQPPALHGREPARDGDEGDEGDEGEPRPTDTAAVRLPTTRFYVAIQLSGDVELLQWWPDTLGADLPPVDHGLGEWVSPAPGAPFDATEARRRHRALLAQDLWTIARRSDPGPWALYTFVDLTDDELDALEPDGRDLSAEVEESITLIERIVEAIAAQTRAFFGTDMPQKLQQLIEARRRHLQGRRRAVRSLTWPTGWKYDTPTLTALPATTDPATTDPATTDPATTDPATTDPATTDPATTDPATTDPATTDPATTDPATTDPATTDPATTDPATTDPATTDPATTDPATGPATETNPKTTARTAPDEQPQRDVTQEPAVGEPARTSIDGSTSSRDTSAGDASVGDTDVRDVALGQPTRLADASFTDLLRTIRVWADAVHRHPTAYVQLAEERISDLLAATLNAALPGAQREVYSRSGKTDLYVRADVLATGAAPAKVFICECKRWSGPGDIDGDLNQLLGYLDGSDTAAVLLYIIDRTHPARVHRTVAAKLRARPEYRSDEEPIVDGWPLLRLQTATGQVRLCLVFLDLTATRSAADRQARKRPPSTRTRKAPPTR